MFNNLITDHDIKGPRFQRQTLHVYFGILNFHNVRVMRVVKKDESA